MSPYPEEFDALFFAQSAAVLLLGRLPAKCRDHVLRGDQKGFRDCRIAPDWVLFYLRLEQKLVLVLTCTGSIEYNNVRKFAGTGIEP